MKASHLAAGAIIALTVGSVGSTVASFNDEPPSPSLPLRAYELSPAIAECHTLSNDQVQPCVDAAYMTWLEPCVTEDHTANDCKWDASSRGNQRGDSFYVVDQVTYYVGW